MYDLTVSSYFDYNQTRKSQQVQMRSSTYSGPSCAGSPTLDQLHFDLVHIELLCGRDLVKISRPLQKT